MESADSSAADFLAHEGVPTFIDAKHAIARISKVMIIDGGIVLTGSFNNAKAAEEKNAENLLVLHPMRRSPHSTDGLADAFGATGRPLRGGGRVGMATNQVVAVLPPRARRGSEARSRSLLR